MKKLLVLFAVLAISIPTLAVEPLLLEPLDVNKYPEATQNTIQNDTTSTTTTTKDGKTIQVTFPSSAGGFAGNLDANMVPQNAAAQGKPVPKKDKPKVKVQTKQRSQGNSYWNAGGKGTKAFF